MAIEMFITPTFYMMQGLPGSGKSTIAEQIKNNSHREVHIHSSDALREEMFGSADIQDNANALFEQGLYSKGICHMGQAGLTNIVTNCKKRSIGSQGGFGYQSLVDTYDIAIMDSMILAYWLCATTKEKPKRQSISY